MIIDPTWKVRIRIQWINRQQCIFILLTRFGEVDLIRFQQKLIVYQFALHRWWWRRAASTGHLVVLILDSVNWCCIASKRLCLMNSSERSPIIFIAATSCICTSFRGQVPPWFHLACCPQTPTQFLILKDIEFFKDWCWLTTSSISTCRAHNLSAEPTASASCLAVISAFSSLIPSWCIWFCILNPVWSMIVLAWSIRSLNSDRSWWYRAAKRGAISSEIIQSSSSILYVAPSFSFLTAIQS